MTTTETSEKMAVALYPTREQLEALRAGPQDQPIVMVNLLRFKAQADAPDAGLSGLEAYQLYATEMRAFVESKGGRFLWGGRVDSQVLGEGGGGFHLIGLVEYPSRAAFLAIAMDPKVAEIGVHRTAGLEGQWLLAATEMEFPPTRSASEGMPATRSASEGMPASEGGRE